MTTVDRIMAIVKPVLGEDGTVYQALLAALQEQHKALTDAHTEIGGQARKVKELTDEINNLVEFGSTAHMDGYEGGKQEARDAAHAEIAELTQSRDAYQVAADKLAGELKALQELTTQEPVDYQIQILGGRWTHCAKHLYDPKNPATRALYAAPQPAQHTELSNEVITELWMKHSTNHYDFARAVIKRKTA